MWVAVVIIVAIVVFLVGGVAYIVWERRADRRIAEDPQAMPDPDAPGTEGPPVG
jgi:flagellar basal body-associated protein FliL